MLNSQHIENICHHYFGGLFLFFLFFNHSGESLYDPPRLNLFCEVYNAMNQCCHRQIYFLSFFLLILFIYLSKRDSKSFAMILSVSLPISIPLLSIFVYVVRLSLKSFEDTKLIANNS